jgi:hypothetical protein
MSGIVKLSMAHRRTNMHIPTSPAERERERERERVQCLKELCGGKQWRRGLLGKWGNERIFLPPWIRENPPPGINASFPALSGQLFFN